MNRSELNRRWRDFYGETGVKTVEWEGLLWREYEHMIVPVGPASIHCSVDDDTVRFLLEEFPRAAMVRCTKGFTDEEEPAWYCVVCDTFLPMEAMAQEHRHKTRRGFRDCTVEPVDASLIVKSGYDIYISAFARYRGAPVPESRAVFVHQAEVAGRYSDIVEYWGVFHEGALVGFGIDFVFGDEEVNYSTGKMAPEGLACYGTYALMYSMGEHYLTGDHRCRYVNAGFRSVFHQTNVQSFLMTNFGFRKQSCPLTLYYRPWLAMALRLSQPVKQVVSRLVPRSRPLFVLDDARARNSVVR